MSDESVAAFGVKASLIGKSEASEKMLRFAERAAKSDFTILLTGETGAGKDHMAQLIHDEGYGRMGKKFVPFDCGCVDPELFASELFGHLKGSFTGAVSTKSGLVTLASGGTLFFNEVANIPMNVQPRFLRILEKLSFRQVGGHQEFAVNTRIIAATNADLSKMVSSGTMREDVYFRLNVVPFRVPPLRERKEDIMLIAEYFLQEELKVGKQFDRRAAAILNEYSWPGNVRELRSVVVNAVFNSEDESTIGPQHMSVGSVFQIERPELPAVQPPVVHREASLLYSDHMREYYRRLITAARGKRAEAVRLSGRSRPAIEANLVRYNLVEYAEQLKAGIKIA